MHIYRVQLQNSSHHQFYLKTLPGSIHFLNRERILNFKYLSTKAFKDLSLLYYTFIGFKGRNVGKTCSLDLGSCRECLGMPEELNCSQHCF